MKHFILDVSAPIRKHLYIYLASFVVLSILVAASLILKFESGYAGSPIKTASDAFWWGLWVFRQSALQMLFLLALPGNI